jgi:hypothetical protein
LKKIVMESNDLKIAKLSNELLVKASAYQECIRQNKCFEETKKLRLEIKKIEAELKELMAERDPTHSREDKSASLR